MELNGQQRKKLRLALQQAFPTREALARMVDEDLDAGASLNEISNSGSLETDVYELIVWAIARGSVMQLLIAAMEANPDNPKLREFAQTVKPPEGLAGEPERIVLKHAPYQDLDQWMSRLTTIRQAVGRILYQGHPVGTGFLVARDKLLTNQHVIDEIRNHGGLQQSGGVEGVSIEFDTGAGNGKPFQLARAEPLASSPYEALDYALLQIDVGEDETIAEPVELQAGRLEEGDPLLILQHPDGLPLKLGVGTVMRIEETVGRCYYNTSTNPGSSGGPCLNAGLQLVAVHARGSLEENSGVLLAAILKENSNALTFTP